jgi:hypothetical protein
LESWGRWAAAEADKGHTLNPTARIVVAPDGSEVLFINSIQGVVISGWYKRQ